MASIEELRKTRLEKLEKLRKMGFDPYPARVERTHTASELGADFGRLERAKKKVFLVGRLRGLRRHGGAGFIDVEDETGRFQVFLEEAKLGPETYEVFGELTDIGDFVEVSGRLFKTKKDEKTLHAETFRIIAKALRPIPEEHFGLKDVEERLRRRYLDLAVNQETREIFRKKAQFWKTARAYLDQHGFLEVDTPVLEDVPGGAEARPFVTHHNALDRDFYLRISLELPLKKVIIGGFEKIYEIGKVFRNEGLSAEHLQDYLHCEFYWAYADFDDLMKFVQEMYKEIIIKTTGTLQTIYNGQKIDWSAKNWPVIEFYDLFKEHLGFEPGTERSTVQKALKKQGLDPESPRGWDLLYKKVIRPKLIQPSFMIRPPVAMEPLAKRDPEDNHRVLRLQVVAAGTELGKGFSELNDPLDQRARFEDQMAIRAKGDEEAQMMDEDFVEALEYGLPPAVGFGFSERLFAVLMNRPVRETVLFPLMRRKEDL